MFVLHYSKSKPLARVTFTPNGNQRIVVNNTSAIHHAAASMLHHFLLQYLNHRYQTYAHVGHASTQVVAAAISSLKNCPINYAMVMGWLRKNQQFLQNIQPRKKNTWNEKLTQLFPQA